MALPISKPLRGGGYIADSSVEHMWVNFKYERLPIFCFFFFFLVCSDMMYITV